jgi:hypothetical protein
MSDPSLAEFRQTLRERYDEYQAAWHTELMRDDPDENILLDLNSELHSIELLAAIFRVQL